MQTAARRPQFLQSQRVAFLFHLVRQYFLHALENLWRRIEDFFYQRFQLFSGCRFHIHPGLFRFGKDLGVIQGLNIGFSQYLNSFRRRAWRHHHRTAKISGSQHDLGNTAVICRNLILIEDFENGGYLGCP